MVAADAELVGATASIDAAAPADAIPLRLRRRGGSPRQVLAISLIGAVVLASLASRDLPAGAERLGDAPVGETMQRLAAEWDGAMAGLGLVRPHEALRRAIRRLLDFEWPGHL